jgi:5-methylcytosine-specific restriction endonuclease McrA
MATKEQCKAYYLANRESIRVRQNSRRKVEINRACADAWAKANPKKRAEAEARRRARKNETEVERVDFEMILERDGMWCYLCEREVEDPNEIHFDHVIPLSRGGTHTFDNLKVTHGSCNLKKGAHYGS